MSCAHKTQEWMDGKLACLGRPAKAGATKMQKTSLINCLKYMVTKCLVVWVHLSIIIMAEKLLGVLVHFSMH